MLRSLYAAVSGVKAHQTYLDVTGNNIANVNTVGYKRDVLHFRDMIYQSVKNPSAPDNAVPIGGIDPAQVGLGVQIGSIEHVFTQGSSQSTGIATDMMISGEGFFVVQNDGQTLYTRAGNFSLDSNGNLVMQGNGYLVQGYAFKEQMNQATGTVERVRDSRLSTVNIQIGQKIPAKATTLLAFKCNLSSSCTPQAKYITSTTEMYSSDIKRAFSVNTGNQATFFASDTSVTNGTALEEFAQSIMKTNDHVTKISVYDSLGNQYTQETVWRKVVTKPANTAASPPTSAETEWDWYSYYVDADGKRLESDPNATPPILMGGEGAGTLVFGDDGLLKRSYYYEPEDLAALRSGAGNATLKEVFIVDGQPRTALTGGDLTVTGKVGADFNTEGSEGSVTTQPPGYEPNSIELDFLGYSVGRQVGTEKAPIDGITQYSSATSTTTPYYQDGYAMGTLDSWSVSQTGIITGSFTNGKSLPIAQVALAMFANTGGLLKVGETCFAETVNSGMAQIGTPMEGGAGKIVGNTIEMSNVDLTEEFVNLIRAQRGFQANTRVVTTSDQVLEELINMKR
ncbi:MAG: flagellar hook protein FlgE [Synergistaceae bacterium]|jgi:flagellar hook protein FlgE|nr:flagellar hook protein FlgE [Synergistaceae bacterium]